MAYLVAQKMQGMSYVEAGHGDIWLARQGMVYLVGEARHGVPGWRGKAWYTWLTRQGMAYLVAQLGHIELMARRGGHEPIVVLQKLLESLGWEKEWERE